MSLKEIKYQQINPKQLKKKQKEMYNYQKVSAILADYGYITIWLSDDWNGADFLAVHKEGNILKIQLKVRMVFAKKYEGKDLYICFGDKSGWYIYPHDEFFSEIMTKKSLTPSWAKKGAYSFSKPSVKDRGLLSKYRIPNVQEDV